MKKQIKTLPTLNIDRKKKITKSLFLIIPVIMLALGCKKSSVDSGGGPPPCTTDSCILTSHNWRIASSTIYTDIGNYPKTSVEAANLAWATFLFNADSTITLTGGGHGNYTYTPSN